MDQFAPASLSQDSHSSIELQKRADEPENHVVRLKIIRDGNQREWWLNGKKTSLKAVQALTKGLSIQIDNLCQFLPQEKVSEFAALSPVELLQQTQRAAAPEYMLEWHDELKNLRKEQKSLDDQVAIDKENLQTQETRMQNLHAEVQRLHERNQIIEKVDHLRKTVPFVEYKIARKEYSAQRKKKTEAIARLQKLEEQLGPTLESINAKEVYKTQISRVVRERKEATDHAERDADAKRRSIEAIDENFKQKEAAIEEENVQEGHRKREFQNIQSKIRDLKARLNEEPIVFDGPQWNERIVSLHKFDLLPPTD